MSMNRSYSPQCLLPIALQPHPGTHETVGRKVAEHRDRPSSPYKSSIRNSSVSAVRWDIPQTCATPSCPGAGLFHFVVWWSTSRREVDYLALIAGAPPELC